MSQLFISYSRTQEEYAQAFVRYVRSSCEAHGINIWIDENLPPGKRWDDGIKNAIDDSDIAVLLFSHACLNSSYMTKTELPYLLDCARSTSLRLIPVRLAPYHASPTHKELCDQVWDYQGRPRSKENILEHYEHVQPGLGELIYHEVLRDILATHAQGAASLRSAPDSSPRSLYLVYDWLDRRSVGSFVRDLRELGVEVRWDQDWECAADFQNKAAEAIGRADLVLVYSTPQCQHSRWILSDVAEARRLKKPLMVIDVADEADRNEVLVGEEGRPNTNVRDLVLELSLETHAQAPSPFASLGPGELLEAARVKNLGIPTDTMTDRLFLSPRACELVEWAYERRGHGDAAERLRATLEYARLCRFRGTWKAGLDALTEVQQGFGKDELGAECLLELGALEFEQGDPGAGLERVETAYTILHGLGVSESLVKVLRQLGNMKSEHEDMDLPTNRLKAAIAFAEHLLHQPGIAHPVSLARKLLWLDCRRELASLLLRREMIDTSVAELESIVKEAQRVGRTGEHLRGVALYHLGRAYHEHKMDNRTARKYFEESLEILRRYDNPIRLAFLCDHLGRILTYHRPLGDPDEPLRLIKRAELVRKTAGHEYMLGKTQLSRGHFHSNAGRLDKAIRAYEKARRIFHGLEKSGALATTYQALGRAFKRGNRVAEARSAFQEAQAIYRRLDIEPKVHEVQYELVWLNNHPDAVPLETWVAINQSFGHSATLSDIGEYRFHRWITAQSIGDTQPRSVTVGNGLEVIVEVDIGDDAASLRVTPSLANHEVVMTTDAAPGSICRSPDPADGTYAGQFSVVQTISDLAAMGATPVAILLNLYLERSATLQYAMDVVKSVLDESRKYGVLLIGGDVKERKEQSVGCVGVGVVQAGRAIRRSGAEPGDIIAMTQGGIGPGVRRKIGRRWAQEILEHRQLDQDTAFKGLFDPKVKRSLLFTPMREMIAAEKSGLVKSAIDTSDGFLGCLQLLARSSEHKGGIGFELDADRIEDLIDEDVRQIAFKLGLDPAQFLFNAGHDWEIVLTTSPESFSDLQNAVEKETDGTIVELGRVCKKTEALAKGVAYRRKDRRLWIPFFSDEKFVSRSYEYRPLEWEDLKFYFTVGIELDQDNRHLASGIATGGP